MKEEQLILIVDDNEGNLKILANILSANSYRVALAKRGQEAIDFVHNKEPDLILLDIMMPDINGIEVCKRLKENEKAKKIPVIFISVLKETEKKIKGFEVGGVDYITKPFQKEEVLARVETQLELYQTQKKLEIKNEEQNILLENIETQIWYLRDEETYGKVNTSHAQFLGFKKEEIEDRSVFEFLDYGDVKAWVRENREVFKKKEQIKKIERVKNAEGEERLLKIIKTPKLDESGDVEYIVCSGDDITEKKELENDLKRRIELENLIIDLSRHFINSDKILEEQIKIGLKDLGHFFEVDYSYIYFAEENKREIYEHYKWATDKIDISTKVIADPNFDLHKFPWVLDKIEKNEVIHIPEINQLPPAAKNLKKELLNQDVRSTLMVPLKYSNQLIGVLGLDTKDRKKEWSAKELSTFDAIADIFTNVIERKRDEEKINQAYLELEMKNMELESLYEDLSEEFKKASQLHQQFLPTNLPEIEGITYDTYFKPADRLGGDFYDIFELEGEFLFYLADVSGHGLDGSMLNIFLRENINNYLLYEHNDGEELNLSQLITYIAEKYSEEDFPDNYFICLLLGVLDIDEMEINFANAGFQFPPIKITKEGEIISLDCSGMPISAVVNRDIYLEQQEERISLEQGEDIFLTTDGLLEERSGDQMYGEERLKEVLAANHSLPASLIINRVKEDFEEFARSSRGQDDLTFFTLKRDLEVIDQFRTKIQSSIAAMYEAQAAVAEFIDPYYEPPELICIGFQEVVTNAIEHGNNMNPNKEVAIEIEVTREYIKVIIIDEGTGFDWQAKIDRKLDLEDDLKDVEERGRGIKLANKAFDEVWYNEKGNKAYLFKKREK